MQFLAKWIASTNIDIVPWHHHLTEGCISSCFFLIKYSFEIFDIKGFYYFVVRVHWVKIYSHVFKILFWGMMYRQRISMMTRKHLNVTDATRMKSRMGVVEWNKSKIIRGNLGANMAFKAPIVEKRSKVCFPNTIEHSFNAVFIHSNVLRYLPILTWQMVDVWLTRMQAPVYFSTCSYSRWERFHSFYYTKHRTTLAADMQRLRTK